MAQVPLNLVQYCTEAIVNDSVENTTERKDGWKMNCPNVTECPCTNTECENYGKCCTCVANHRERGNLPVCLRPKEE